MKVIVAGFPKTGTKSLNAALQVLGYNVYDFIENTTYLGEQWVKIFKDGWTTQDFVNMYENVDAVVDVPCSYFWEEIHKAFPEAKIILLIRDEDSWYNSFKAHRHKMEDNFALRLISIFSPIGRISMGAIFNKYLPQVIYGINEDLLWKPFRRVKVNESLLRLKYRAHNAYVMQNAPAEKLLIFNVSEGWEPLCKFLELPVPDEAFPHENQKTGIVQKMMEVNPIALKMQREVKIRLAAIAVVSVAAGCFIYMKGPQNLYNSVTKILANRLDQLTSK